MKIIYNSQKNMLISALQHLTGKVSYFQGSNPNNFFPNSVKGTSL
jgi:hypothetical protein